MRAPRGFDTAGAWFALGPETSAPGLAGGRPLGRRQLRSRRGVLLGLGGERAGLGSLDEEAGKARMEARL